MSGNQIVLGTLAQQDDGPAVTTLVFVYGTLMRGFRNHRLLAQGGCHYLGRGETRPQYTLVDLGPFPGLLDVGTTRVRGEVYEVDAPTLAKLDRLEGHPRFYERKPVALARRPASLRTPNRTSRTISAYFLPREEYGHRPLIVTGDWRR